MVKILFICHGNICRSPMAEFIFNNLAKKACASEWIEASSAATSTEEIGNPVHPGTRRILEGLGISCRGKRAVQLRKRDYEEYDYLIGMDSWNIRNMLRILGGDRDKKVYKLLDFTSRPGDVADPWYTGDFETTYQDVLEGCEGLLRKILEER